MRKINRLCEWEHTWWRGCTKSETAEPSKLVSCEMNLCRLDDPRVYPAIAHHHRTIVTILPSPFWRICHWQHGQHHDKSRTKDFSGAASCRNGNPSTDLLLPTWAARHGRREWVPQIEQLARLCSPFAITRTNAWCVFYHGLEFRMSQQRFGSQLLSSVTKRAREKDREGGERCQMPFHSIGRLLVSRTWIMSTRKNLFSRFHSRYHSYQRLQRWVVEIYKI